MKKSLKDLLEGVRKDGRKFGGSRQERIDLLCKIVEKQDETLLSLECELGTTQFGRAALSARLKIETLADEAPVRAGFH